MEPEGSLPRSQQPHSRPDQLIYLTSNLLSYSHLGLDPSSSGIFPLVFPHQNLVQASPLTHTTIRPPANLILLGFITLELETVLIIC